MFTPIDEVGSLFVPHGWGVEWIQPFPLANTHIIAKMSIVHIVPKVVRSTRDPVPHPILEPHHMLTRMLTHPHARTEHAPDVNLRTGIQFARDDFWGGIVWRTARSV